MNIMRCLITSTNASSFSQANAHGSDSDLTAIASRKVFYGLIITANFGKIILMVEHYEGLKGVAENIDRSVRYI